MALMALLAVLTIGIVIAAFPGSQPVAKPAQEAQQQIGVAPKGWFQKAQREFHH
jgi:hypothetical protein